MDILRWVRNKAFVKFENSNDRDKNEGCMDYRVFVCQGFLGNQSDIEDIETKRITNWVMTFSKEFDEVTMWDCINTEQTTLIGRVENTEKENLKAYLTTTVLSPVEQ